MINKIPLLQEWYERAGGPDVVDWDKSKTYKGLHLNGKLFFSKVGIKTNYSLLSTLFHEIYHAYQDLSGLTAIITHLYGPINPIYNKFGVPTISQAILEVGAYSFEISLGNTNTSTASLLLYHQRIVGRYFSD